MKVSQVIKVLQEAIKEVGDVDFIVNTEVDGNFCLEFNREVALIEVPLTDDESVLTPVGAVLNFTSDDVEEDDNE